MIMKNDLIYLYCVTDRPPFPGQSIESHGLNFIQFKNYYMIIRYVPHSEFSEENLKRNLTDIHWLEIMAGEHTNVINKVMQYNRAIPFELGTIFDSEENLKKFITDHSETIIKNLIHVNGTEE
jgi:hypothetical protein